MINYFRKPFHLLICDREFASELINKVIQPKLEPSQVRRGVQNSQIRIQI
jgi:hypothetical protein